MRRSVAFLFWLSFLGLAQAATCATQSDAGRDYVVCTVDVRRDHLSLFEQDAAGHPIATFERLSASLAGVDRRVVFAMNAGMYEPDLSPVGLFVERGETRHPATTREGSGNFFLKPNGVFFFGPATVGIKETQAFLDAHLHPDFATQSGPMLVIDGALHQRFQADSASLKIRNGVGVRDSHTALFVISEQPVSFFQFATLFRDVLRCPNALFLDGTVSTLYAPSMGRTRQLVPLGPMVGVTAP